MSKGQQMNQVDYIQVLKEQALALQDSITTDDMQGQATLSRPPRIKIHQSNTMNAPDESQVGMFYSNSSFCPPTEELLVIILGQNDGLRNSTPYDDPDKHVVCSCVIAGSRQGVPFIQDEKTKKWFPGEKIRDCWFCEYNLAGKGLPKLPPMNGATRCKTYRQWAINLLIFQNNINGIAAKLEVGAMLFMPEYNGMQPQIIDNIPYGPVDFLTFSLKMLNVPSQSAIVSIRTKQLKTEKGVFFVPIFGIKRLLDKAEFNASRAINGKTLNVLELTGKVTLEEFSEDFDDSDSVSHYNNHEANTEYEAYDVPTHAGPNSSDEVDEVDDINEPEEIF